MQKHRWVVWLTGVNLLLTALTLTRMIPAVVAEGREGDQSLSRRPDRRDLPLLAILRANPILGLAGRQPPEPPRRPPLHAGLVHPHAVDEDD